MPLAPRTRLYQAFGIEAAYKHDVHQLTCRATPTTSTPRTVTAIVNDSNDPAPASSDSALPAIWG